MPIPNQPTKLLHRLLNRRGQIGNPHPNRSHHRSDQIQRGHLGRHELPPLQEHLPQRSGRAQHPRRRVQNRQNRRFRFCQRPGPKLLLSEKWRRADTGQVDGAREFVRPESLPELGRLVVWGPHVGDFHSGWKSVSFSAH